MNDFSKSDMTASFINLIVLTKKHDCVLDYTADHGRK